MKYIAIALLILTVAGRDGSAHSSRSDKMTSLRGANMEGLTDVIKRGGYREAADMLAAGADPNRPDGRGLTPMVAAAANPDVRFLEMLIAHGGRPLDGKYEDPICYSVSRGLHTGDWSNYYALISRTSSKTITLSSSNAIMFYIANVGQFDKILDLLNKGYPVDRRKLLRMSEISGVAEYGPELGYKQKVIGLLKLSTAR